MSTANEREPVSTSTDCRSYEGVNVGLIDSIITACRVLAKRQLYGHAVTEALNDMRADRDVLKIVANFKDDDLMEVVNDNEH